VMKIAATAYLLSLARQVAGAHALERGELARPMSVVQAAAFQEVLRDLDQLLELAGKTSGTTVRQTTDSYGFTWVELEDDDFDDLVSTTHLVNQTIEERGFSEQLLCSVFGMRPEPGGRVAYLVYLYKRGTFYPFVPSGDHERDSVAELRLKATLGGELPIEPELERWYPLWDVPVAG